MNVNSHPSAIEANAPGQAIRAVRQRKGMTLAQVSERTGLAISSLSKLEKGLTSLSYDKLMLLSRGLDVDMATLLDPAAGRTVVAAPARGRRVVQRAGEGQLVETQSYRQLYLSTELLSKQMTPIMVDIRARSLSEFLNEFGGLIKHPGEEFTLVLEGELEFHSELYAPLKLSAGESIYFDSEMGHAYINATNARCSVICVSSAPGEDAGVPGMIVNASARISRGHEVKSADATPAAPRGRKTAKRRPKD